MSQPLQLTVTIDEDNLGPLISAALKLNAKIDALGLIESVPTYHKNKTAPRLVLPLKLPAPGQKKLRRPLKDVTHYSEDNLRKIRARDAVTEAIRATGPEGLLITDGMRVYIQAGGNAQGFGPVWRNAWKKKHNHLFLKEGQ